MGGTGNIDYLAYSSAIAWNAETNQFLIVWHGDHNAGGLADGEIEIFGQLLDAGGSPVGIQQFRISDMGGTGANPFDGMNPDVIWNPYANEYLVAWYGDDDEPELGDNKREIFGQHLDASGGEIGANDFRISDADGLNDSIAYVALHPAVAFRSNVNELLVVWEADDIEGTPAEREISGKGCAGRRFFVTDSKAATPLRGPCRHPESRRSLLAAEIISKARGAAEPPRRPRASGWSGRSRQAAGRCKSP